ncbi:phosphonate metabolism protein/1,5-bisphosphokinase (PRPP-forming) PhnN [Bradyrhizobium brasilense]|uniref:phosphonate metabolism protein/1,5-bisphosphokinase (PRPP-forming) PhnN n=1 Tax=Bradyrhizobium brasilense TaxID=1419277 RepID=UPI0028773116|nr:phosphonate metabolism protein/1,5-bisphosphokinase (PRPP-forming) PhnN [Bradyrhizobium brasilense]MCP3418651.1 phosphonate metabolism protein/1,5-bisphosphokinase (PRPP-forming) PhnN [Bradyrhizobium brasilense]
MTTARGQLVLVVGPSGAGKDTLIDYARAHSESGPCFHFVRRVITRPPSIGEDYESIGVEEFQRQASAGKFALHWQAHGLFYGIPAAVEDHLDRGIVVVANGSRAVVPLARQRYPQLRVLNVTAPVEVLSKRLRGRGRESESSLEQRLARSDLNPVDGTDVLHIDNAGSLSVSGERFIDALRTCRGTSTITSSPTGPSDGQLDRYNEGTE